MMPVSESEQQADDSDRDVDNCELSADESDESADEDTLPKRLKLTPPQASAEEKERLESRRTIPRPRRNGSNANRKPTAEDVQRVLQLSGYEWDDSRRRTRTLLKDEDVVNRIKEVMQRQPNWTDRRITWPDVPHRTKKTLIKKVNELNEAEGFGLADGSWIAVFQITSCLRNLQDLKSKRPPPRIQGTSSTRRTTTRNRSTAADASQAHVAVHSELASPVVGISSSTRRQPAASRAALPTATTAPVQTAQTTTVRLLPLVPAFGHSARPVTYLTHTESPRCGRRQEEEVDWTGVVSSPRGCRHAVTAVLSAIDSGHTRRTGQPVGCIRRLSRKQSTTEEAQIDEWSL